MAEPPGPASGNPELRAPLPSPPDGIEFDVASGGDVVRLTLNRPDVRNAQLPAMWDGLRHFGSNLPPSVRVVVIRAAGRSFSAGLDRSVLTSTGPDAMPALAATGPTAVAERISQFQDAFNWLARPDIVSIAAVHGHAVGAGFQLALACHLRVVADDAIFRMAEVALGLVPDLGGTKRLVDLVGPARALAICTTGRDVPADEAGRIGLADHVVPTDHLEAAVQRLVDTIVAHDPTTVREITALLTAAPGNTHAAQQQAEREAQARRLTTLFPRSR